jgi:hypothetical protein
MSDDRAAPELARGALVRVLEDWWPPSDGPPAASISSSDRTRSSARSRRSTRAMTRKDKLVRDFIAAWDEVMNLDRSDRA